MRSVTVLAWEPEEAEADFPPNALRLRTNLPLATGEAPGKVAAHPQRSGPAQGVRDSGNEPASSDAWLRRMAEAAIRGPPDGRWMTARRRWRPRSGRLPPRSRSAARPAVPQHGHDVYEVVSSTTTTRSSRW